MEPEVKHEEKYQQFTITFDGEEDEAELAYALPGNGVINFTHSYVPVSARGQGILKKLMEAGLQFARDNNLEVRASCSAAASYLHRLKA